MKMRLHALLSLIVLLGSASTGCAGFAPFFVSYAKQSPHYWEDTLGSSFYGHRSPVVRYSAITGLNAGVIIGAPLWVTGVATACVSGMGDAGFVFLLPYTYTIMTCGICAGAPAWALCGWWWPKPQEEKDPGGLASDDQNEKAME